MRVYWSVLRGRCRITGAVIVQLILVTVLVGGATVVILERPGNGNADAARVTAGAGGPAHQEMNMDSGQLDSSTAYYGITRTPKLIVQVDVTPALVGDNTMLLTVLGSENAPQKVLNWMATAFPAAGGAQITQGTPIQVLPMSDNVARAYLRVPSAGDWRLKITVSTAGNGAGTVTQTMKIGAAGYSR